MRGQFSGRKVLSDQIPNPADFGMHGLCPHLVCKGAADAIDFYVKAFGATELMRLPGPDGRLMHGTVKINNCMVMLADEFGDVGVEHSNKAPPTLGGTPVIMHLVVDDCDAWAERAVAAGAKIIVPLADQFWGDRYGMIEDPFGHRWALATQKSAPVMGVELVEAMNKAMDQQMQK
jgi:PhnB protein